MRSNVPEPVAGEDGFVPVSEEPPPQPLSKTAEKSAVAQSRRLVWRAMGRGVREVLSEGLHRCMAERYERM